MPGPVLLVHGLAASAATTWRDAGWLDLLADAGRTTIAPDLPGHGATALPPPGAPIDLTAFLLDLVSEREPADAIGFSLGARTVLLAAAAAPERFDRVVVAGIGANLFRQDDSMLRVADALDAGDAGDPMARYFLDHASRSGTDPHGLARLLRECRPEVTGEHLARLTMPVLVVIGEHDFAGPGEPLAEALPDATLVTLPGVDHFSTPKNFGFLDAALAARLAGRPLAAVYTSTLARARDTGRPLAEQRALPVVERDDLREVFLGEWEGGEFRRRAAERDPEYLAFVEAGRWDVIPGAERDDDLRERMRRAVQEIAAAHVDGSVAVVSHGGAINAWLAQHTGAHRGMVAVIDNTSVTTLRTDGERWMVLGVNDRHHLGDPLRP